MQDMCSNDDLAGILDWTCARRSLPRGPPMGLLAASGRQGGTVPTGPRRPAMEWNLIFLAAVGIAVLVGVFA